MNKESTTFNRAEFDLSKGFAKIEFCRIDHRNHHFGGENNSIEQEYEREYLIIIGGVPAGTISKIRDTRFEVHPWKAFYFRGKIEDKNQPEGYVYDSRFLGSFFGSHGKLDAVEATAEAFANIRYV